MATDDERRVVEQEAVGQDEPRDVVLDVVGVEREEHEVGLKLGLERAVEHQFLHGAERGHTRVDDRHWARGTRLQGTLQHRSECLVGLDPEPEGERVAEHEHAQVALALGADLAATEAARVGVEREMNAKRRPIDDLAGARPHREADRRARLERPSQTARSRVHMVEVDTQRELECKRRNDEHDERSRECLRPLRRAVPITCS